MSTGIVLDRKPDSSQAMERIEAWFAGEVIDRPPVRFSRHNAFAEAFDEASKGKWTSHKERWFDAEHQVERFRKGIEGKTFLAETFPVFWPNLGPDVYAATHGCELEYGEVTSWSRHCIGEWGDLERICFDLENAYFKKIEELMTVAMERASGAYLVGYTDLHPGLDCVLAWRGGNDLCVDLIDHPEKVHRMVELANRAFARVYDHFDAMLKSRGHPSVTWMEIPVAGRFYIPSCDFAAMISADAFREFALPAIRDEVKRMTHNVFHLDGKGVARVLGDLLEVPEIRAIQWVQGMGRDKPIMQWVPLIRRILDAGRSVVVDLEKGELEPFIETFKPEGIFLCLASDSEEEERAILKRIEKWAD